MSHEVTVVDLHRMIGEGTLENAIIVDVRMPFEVVSGRIERSVNIPLGEILSKKDQLRQYGKVYLICQSGGRSMLAMTELEIAGFTNAYNVVGGMRAWKEHDFPIV